MGLRNLRGTTTTHPTTHTPFDDILRELDARTEATASVTVESRRYGKAVTVIEGLDERADLPDLVRDLKKALATGGIAKEGRIELQGDHRRRALAILAMHKVVVKP